MIASSRATAKARRAEERYAAVIRKQVMEVRDASCRIACKGVGPCEGVLEWMHIREKRRCFTRGMEPEQRHATAWTLAGCTRHHRLYDAHVYEIEYLTDAGADGPIRVVTAQGCVDECR